MLLSQINRELELCSSVMLMVDIITICSNSADTSVCYKHHSLLLIAYQPQVLFAFPVFIFSLLSAEMYNVFHILNCSGTHCCLWLEAFTIRNLPPMTWLPNHSFLGFFSLLSCHMEIAGQQLRSIMNHLMQLCDGTISLFP